MGCVPCNQKWQVPIKKAAAGAVGLAKAAAGIDRVDDAALMARLEACGRCAELRRLVRGVAAGELPGLSDTCGRCGCLVQAKARLRAETCPAGHWERTDGAG